MSEGFIEDAFFVYGKESAFELKCKDVSVSSGGNDISDLVGDILMGTGWDQRVGDEIFIHRIDIRGYQRIIPPLFNTASGQCMNLLLIDTQCQGGAPPGSNDPFADYTTADGIGIESPVFARLDLAGRYVIVARDEGLLPNFVDGYGAHSVKAHNETISASAPGVNPMNYNPFTTEVPGGVLTNTPALQSTQAFPDTVSVPVHQIDILMDNLGVCRPFSMSVMFSPPLKIRYDEDLATPNALGAVPFFGSYCDCSTGAIKGMFVTHANISTYFTDDPIPYQKIAGRLANNFMHGTRKRRVSMIDGSIPKFPRLFHEDEPVSTGGKKRSFEVESRKRYRESSKR